jgi:hypothetical protein
VQVKKALRMLEEFSNPRGAYSLASESLKLEP